MKFLLPILLLLPAFLNAQSSIEDIEIFPGPEWYQGSILLNNGKELEGLIKYNDKNDIVCFERGRDSRSFTARTVKAFEFFDEIEKKQRVFYAVPVEDTRHNVKRPLFFEVLMDLKNFAVLSKISPIKFEKREYTTPAIFNPATGSFSAGRYYGYPSTVSHTETLFVLSKNGLIKPYLQIIEKDVDGMFYDRSISKNIILDNDALKINTSPYYNKLQSFAKQNDLSFDHKNDLIAILKYYEQLSRY